MGALAGLAVHDLPLDELIDYRSHVEAVDIEAVHAAARDHIHLERAAIVLVGDVDAIGPGLEAAGLGTLVIDRDDAPRLPIPTAAEIESSELVGPADESDDAGPTAGAQEPSLPGTDEPASADVSSGRRQRRWPAGPMIVVIGRLAGRLADGTTVADGLAAGIAQAAVGAGAGSEIITKVGNDPAGDAVLLGLGRAGVGHVATLRDPAWATSVRAEPADDLEVAAEASADQGGPIRSGRADPRARRRRIGAALHP